MKKGSKRRIKKPILEISWLDSFGRAEWHDAEEDVGDTCLVNTVGYFLGEDKEYIRTVATFIKSAKVCNSMCIPKGSIVSMRILKGAGKLINRHLKGIKKLDKTRRGL